MASTRYARVGHGHQYETGYTGSAIQDNPDDTIDDRRAAYDRDTPRNYRPIVLRTPSLLILLVLTLSLIGLLQYALVRLPNRQGRFGLDSLKNATAEVEAFVGGRTSALGKRQQSSFTSSPAPPSAATDAYIITIQTATNVGSTEDSPLTPSSTAPDQSRPKDDYVPQTTTMTTSEEVSPTETATEDLVTAAAANTGDYVPQRASVPTKTADDYIAQDIRTEPTLQTTPNEVYVRPTETLETATTTSDLYVPVIATPSHSGVTAPHPDVYVPDAETKGVEIIVWSPVQAFLGTYLAVLLAVFYRILISAVHTQVRLIDPFRQLMGSEGALASTAFFSSYHSHDMFGPISALIKGRGMLCLTGLAFWLSCLLPALSSEAIFVDTNWDCPNPEVGKPNACPPRMTASTLVVRLLQGLLGFVAVVIIGLAWMSRRETGLQSDPSSIAAIAHLMGHPSLNSDLNELPRGSGVTINAMKQEIGGKRYRLEKWYSRTHDQRYGIVRTGALDRDSSPDSATLHGQEASYRPIDHEDLVRIHRWRWTDYILLFVVTGTLGVVVAYYLVSGNNSFNVFFNSNTFGPRFIVTGAATVITNIWASVEQSSVVMAPFIRLYQGSAAADALHFAPTITPILSTWRAASHKYIFVCVVTLVTLLGEALSVAISGVPFSTGQTWTNFLAVSYISMAILSIMLVVGVVVIVHRRREPRIAIVPDTLGAKLSYLAGSSIVDAGDLSRYDLRSGRFTFGLVSSKDGRRMWRVDRLDTGFEGFS